MVLAPNVYFLRHGQTDWNVAYRLQGQQDIPINKNGRAQAKANGQALLKLLSNPEDYSYFASPLGRTRETMNIVRGELELPVHDYVTDNRLKEISFGQWESFTFDELRVHEAEKVDAREADKFNFQPPLGESYARLLARVESFLPYVPRDSVIVCHGGVLRMLEHILNGTPEDKVVHLAVPQDRIFHWDGKKAVWM